MDYRFNCERYNIEENIRKCRYVLKYVKIFEIENKSIEYLG